MDQGSLHSFNSEFGAGQAFLAPSSERSRTVVVSSSLPERELLSDWAQAHGLALRLSSSRDCPTNDWQDESVALWVVAWADLNSPSGGVGVVSPTLSSVLVIVTDVDYLDLRSIPTDGCMDILRRPYQPDELFWRVRRAMAGTKSRDGMWVTGMRRQLDCGPIVFDEERDEVLVFGQPLTLRRAERAVLVHLIQNADRFVTTHELQSEVLGSHGSGSAARNQVYEVRSKLRALGLPNAILHESQKGYRLNRDG